MTGIADEIAVIRERWARATPGPWWPTERWSRYSPTWHTGEIIASGNLFICQPVAERELTAAELADASAHPNTDAIANAPTDIAWLIQQLEARL